MNRTRWMLIGLAALAPTAIAYKAGTLVGRSHAAPAPPAATAVARADATPSGDHHRSAASAPRCQADPVVEDVVLPEVVIYGHVPGPKHAASAELDPKTVSRLYAGRADEIDLDGLSVTDLDAGSNAGATAVRIADDLPALRADAFALPLPSDELLRPELLRNEDARLPRSAVEGVLDSRRGALEVCYATATRLDPWLPGSADVHFTIAKDGHVERVATHVEGIPDSPASACMRNVVSTLTFARPDRPIDVRDHFGRAPTRSVVGYPRGRSSPTA